MNIGYDFETIISNSHWINWGPDWVILESVYNKFPDSYSILTPFAYAYLEELIRTTTSDYGIELYDKHCNPRWRRTGNELIKLAIKENSDLEYLVLLDKVKVYFSTSMSTDSGDNRSSVIHGYMHPRFWSKESFEDLIQIISLLSKFARF